MEEAKTYRLPDVKLIQSLKFRRRRSSKPHEDL
jgi:hypothetical protein